MIVTIDGPAGAGKSSAAKHLAKRLGFQYLDTGAMYRAVTLAGIRQGSDFQNPDSLEALLRAIHIELPPGKVILNGEDVTQEIRNPKVTDAASALAANPQVREYLVIRQREIADNADMICEGRDQGTVVFPKADCKFFLTANPEERANRRFRELNARGEKITWEEVFHAQLARDKRDSQRDCSPMVPAQDAIVLDSTHLSLDQVVKQMETEVRRCRK